MKMTKYHDAPHVLSCGRAIRISVECVPMAVNTIFGMLVRQKICLFLRS